MTIQTVSFPEIELVRAGTWNSRNGKADITPEDLAAAVEAYADPEVDHGRLKWGHSSTLNEELGDGAPAYGWLENLKLSADGKSLIGDLTDVPKKLAGLIGRAYKQRSVEMRRNVTTPSGRTYRAALTGLALLGASAPAVKGMEDIAALYASENPDGIDDEATQESIVSIELSGDLPPVRPDADAPGDTGVQGPVSDRSNTDHEEEPTVAFLEDARSALGLPDDATEETILAALKTKTETPTDPEPEPVEPAVEPKAEEPKTEPTGEVALSDALNLLKEYEGQVVALSEQVTTLTNAQKERDLKEIIDVALSEGRFGPAKGAELVDDFGHDLDLLRKAIKSHTPGTINLSEAGSEVALSAGSPEAEAAENAYLDRIGF